MVTAVVLIAAVTLDALVRKRAIDTLRHRLLARGVGATLALTPLRRSRPHA